jgi:DNA-binding HxlR family transcriptional regulator
MRLTPAERRTYGQYCPAARALEIVGERWTLLIVRDLLLGPKRYTDSRPS